MTKFDETVKYASKPVLPEFILLVLEILKLPNQGLCNELL